MHDLQSVFLSLHFVQSQVDSRVLGQRKQFLNSLWCVLNVAIAQPTHCAKVHACGQKQKQMKRTRPSVCEFMLFWVHPSGQVDRSKSQQIAQQTNGGVLEEFFGASGLRSAQTLLFLSQSLQILMTNFFIHYLGKLLNHSSCRFASFVHNNMSDKNGIQI